MTTNLIQKDYKKLNVGKISRGNENVVSLLPICRQDKELIISEIQRNAYNTTKIKGFASFFSLSANSEELTKQKKLNGRRKIK